MSAITFKRDTSFRKELFTALYSHAKLLKLSNTLLTNLQKGPGSMFVTGHGHQVFYTVIGSYPIDMMDYPICRQWPLMMLFPYKRMFTNPFVVHCLNFDIASIFINGSTTLPMRTVFSTMCFPITLLAKFRPLKFGFPTSGATVIMALSALTPIPLFTVIKAILQPITRRFKFFVTYWAYRHKPCSHIYIIPQEKGYCRDGTKV